MEYRDISTEKVTTSATSAQSSELGDGIFAIRLVTTVDSHFSIGANPTATTSDAFIPAKTEFYLGVKPTEKVAVRTSTGSGLAFITGVSK